MVRYFLALLLLIVSCSLIEQDTGDISQKNNVDKSTLFDFDLSAKNDTQEDTDPLDFIVSSHLIHSHFKVLDDYNAFRQSLFIANTRYSIKTRAPPLLASA